MTDTDTRALVADAIDQVSAVLAELRAAQAAPFAATDPSGNPGAVAAGELIESTWGNAVAITVVKRYPDVGAFEAANPVKYDGMVVAIGATICSWRAGALRALAPIVRAAADLSANVGAGSTIAVSTPQSFGPYPVPYVARVAVELVAFGSSALATAHPSIRTPDGATVLADGLTYTVPTGMSLAAPQTADVLINAGNTLTLSVWINAGGSALSVAGRASFVLLPA